MPNVPTAISTLPAATSLASADLVPVVAGGTTSKMTFANLMASLYAASTPIKRYSNSGIIVGYTDLRTAVAALQSGDGLELQSGIYNIGATPLLFPPNVSVRGSGSAAPLSFGNTSNMDGTIILGSGALNTGMCIVPGNNNLFTNLSIVSTAGGAFGSGTVSNVAQQAATGVFVRNCYFFGQADAVNVARIGTAAKTPEEINFHSCVFEGNWDAFTLNLATGSTLNQFDCITNIAANTPNVSCVKVVGLGNMGCYNAKMSVTLASTGPTNVISATALGSSQGPQIVNCGLYFPAGSASASHLVGVSLYTGCYTLDGVPLVCASGTVPSISPGSDSQIITTLDPKDADPGSRPLATVAGRLCFYNGKLYVCTNAATPTWELVASS